VQQLRDTEVEELHRAVGRDEDVRRLEVAVDDEVRVRVLHCRQHLEHEREPLLGGEMLLVAVRVDAPALDVLEDEVRLAVVAHAGIEQPRDVQVREPRERGPFAAEALDAGGIEECEVEQLHRDDALVPALAATCKPDAPHAAAADRALERVRAEPTAGEGRGRRGGRGGGAVRQKAVAVELRFGGEQPFDLGGERGGAESQCIEPREARLGREVERLVEQRSELGEELGCGGAGGMRARVGHARSVGRARCSLRLGRGQARRRSASGAAIMGDEICAVNARTRERSRARAGDEVGPGPCVRRGTVE
jgi:hypothetical protein